MAGLYYEEFTIGMEFRHPLTRTLTEMDAIHVLTRIKDKRVSKSGPGEGIVTFEHFGCNQRDQEVCYVMRTGLMRMRPA